MLNKEQLEAKFGDAASFLESSDLGYVSGMCYEIHEKERDEFAMGFADFIKKEHYGYSYKGWFDNLNDPHNPMELFTTEQLLNKYKDTLNKPEGEV